jgi:hypothetical protein
MGIVKVVVTHANGALQARVRDRLLAAGHDARALHGALPPGSELRAAFDGAGAVIHAAGGLRGTVDVELADARRVAKAAAATGTHLVLVVPGPVAAVEAVVESVTEAWTLQPTTTLCDDLAAWLADLEVGPVVAVPKGLALQPVDAGEVAERVTHLLRAGPAGRVPVFGGPAVRPVDDLARAWLRARGRRGLVLRTGRMSEPSGAVTFPDRAVGRVTWEEWLAARGEHGGGETVGAPRLRRRSRLAEQLAGELLVAGSGPGEEHARPVEAGSGGPGRGAHGLVAFKGEREVGFGLLPPSER